MMTKHLYQIPRKKTFQELSKYCDIRISLEDYKDVARE